MVRSGHMSGRVMLVLCNLATSVEGRAAMLDGGAVECFMGLLGRGEFDSVATRESCLTAFYGLSYGGLRIRGLAKEAGAEEVLRKLEEETVGEQGTGLAEKAMVVWSSLAGIEMGREAIVEEGGLAALVEAIEDESDKGKEFAVMTPLQLCGESVRNRGWLVRKGGAAKAKHKV